ncbi:hypothetical protein HC028_20840 [Planosporangium flavigriseum]|uniref:Uncharacterized protein n=1 Tax=Planosporangium flavigriseum TaxID=373681 RepID=A0A8J3LUD1_9ACTN|nr:hypothetical protein [Planosporangium flavigriseum]NJC66934.1 hypothetical protein [Planosporangium flavigriseum]GIG74004.1 hypothetical protein Pfl04_24080 [Planosporangium flavigriseum]
MLIYVGIPVLVILVVTGLVFAGDVRRGKRYRPGRPFEFRPVWFLSAPEQLADATSGEHKALHGTAAAAALPAGGSSAAEWAARPSAEQRVTGGASDRW